MVNFKIDPNKHISSLKEIDGEIYQDANQKTKNAITKIYLRLVEQMVSERNTLNNGKYLWYQLIDNQILVAVLQKIEMVVR